MSVLFKHQYADCLIGVWKIDEYEEDLLVTLPEECRENIATFKNATRRKEYLAVRRLLIEMLGGYTKVDYSPNGKPLISNGYISISHTKGYASVIYSASYDVGIDIEYVSDRVNKIRSYFLNPNEEELFNETPSSLIAWCAKETLFKMINNEGLSVDLKSDLHLTAFDDTQIEVYETATKDQHSYTLSYKLTDTFALVWGVNKPLCNCLTIKDH